jgi:cell division protein FtsL
VTATHAQPLTWTAGLLGAALVASGLVLVHTSYETRRLFASLERERAQARQLEMAQRRLDAERRAQSTTARVETLARQRLVMRPADPSVMHQVVDGAAPVESDLANDAARSPAATAGPSR